MEAAYRTWNLERSTLGEEARESRTIEVSFSSEEVIDRGFWKERLIHKEGAVRIARLGKHAPLLLNHDKNQQIGVIESARIDGGRGYARVRFSRSALGEEVFNDVLDGIRTSMSVGYVWHKIELEEEAKNGPSLYRVVDWEPFEISIVSIPADTSVGTNRNLPIELVTTRKEQPVSGSVDEMREILTLGERMGENELAREFIRRGDGIDRFKAALFEKRITEPIERKKDEDGCLGVSKRERRPYSFVNAISAMATGNWSKAGYEREISQEAQREYQRSAHGVLIPLDLLRDFTPAQGSGGGLVAEEMIPEGFVEMLYNRMVVKRMGATILGNQRGKFKIARQIQGSSAYWVEKSRDPKGSSPVIDQIELAPKSLGAFTDIDRNLITQSNMDVENLVRNDLAMAVALEWDRVALLGTGEQEPRGILNTEGVIKVAAGEEKILSFADIVQLESEVDARNALIENLGYLTTPRLKGYLKSKPIAENTSQFIWTETLAQDGVGGMNGYRAVATNQMSDPSVVTHPLLFGNFASIIMAQWGVIDVLVDPYTFGTIGNLRVRVLLDVDVGIRYPQGFAYYPKCKISAPPPRPVR